MAGHVFLDESKRDAYVMVAVPLPTEKLPVLRRIVRGAQVPGTRRLHFRAERDAIRKAFLATLAAQAVTAQVYVVRGRKDLAARQAILSRVVRNAVADGTERLVLERDDSVLVHDTRVLRSERARLGATDSLRYEVLPAVTEPLLWIPDAVAWAWSRDDAWRRRVAPLVTSVTEL